ncbi:MAG TPA: hypothetical protein VHH73_09115 [Verrucomicrobiae bacterium]|nr:hypothetical protein [Verrucomicrobiae bacterium]
MPLCLPAVISTRAETKVGDINDPPHNYHQGALKDRFSLLKQDLVA